MDTHDRTHCTISAVSLLLLTVTYSFDVELFYFLCYFLGFRTTPIVQGLIPSTALRASSW